jgi:hypothetical protein
MLHGSSPSRVALGAAASGFLFLRARVNNMVFGYTVRISQTTNTGTVRYDVSVPVPHLRRSRTAELLEAGLWQQLQTLDNVLLIGIDRAADFRVFLTPTSAQPVSTAEVQRHNGIFYCLPPDRVRVILTELDPESRRSKRASGLILANANIGDDEISAAIADRWGPHPSPSLGLGDGAVIVQHSPSTSLDTPGSQVVQYTFQDAIPSLAAIFDARETELNKMLEHMELNAFIGATESKPILKSIAVSPLRTQYRLFYFLNSSKIYPFKLSDFDYSVFVAEADRYKIAERMAQELSRNQPNMTTTLIYLQRNGFSHRYARTVASWSAVLGAIADIWSLRAPVIQAAAGGLVSDWTTLLSLQAPRVLIVTTAENEPTLGAICESCNEPRKISINCARCGFNPLAVWHKYSLHPEGKFVEYLEKNAKEWKRHPRPM